MACILSCKDLRTCARIVVVATSILEEPVGSHIVVLIYEVDTELAHFCPTIVELVATGRRTARTTYLYIRIFSSDLLDELSEAHRIDFAPLLVADTYLLEVEWCWMSHVGTKLAPLGVYATIGKLDEVESIIDIRLEVVNSYMRILIVIAILILASQSYRQNR